MSRTSGLPTRERRSTDAVERLYALWLIGTLLTLLLLVVSAFIVAGKLRSAAEELVRLQDRVEALERQRSAPIGEAGAPATTAPAATHAVPAPSRAPAERLEPTPARPAPTTRPAAPEMNDARTRALLESALHPGTDWPFQVADPGAARTLLTQVSRLDADAALSGETWARLAALARLLERDDEAERFARFAEARGRPPHEFHEIAARQLLAADRSAEAMVYARRLFEQTGGAPVARLLYAEACLARQRYGDAAAAIEPLEPPAGLPPADRLRLGRVYLQLDDWPRMRAAVASVGDVSGALATERDFQRAVELIHEGQRVEALAVLDYLREARPNDYDLELWRGVALLEARQFEAARQALQQAAEQNPGRPEAWYWRAMLEIRAERTDEAAVLLANALAAAASYAPAWEALATLALNRGDVEGALDNVHNALQANPRRAEAHFLAAVAYAKRSQADETAAALREAFQRDPTYIEKARQTPVITRLLSGEELDELAKADAATEPVATQP